MVERSRSAAGYPGLTFFPSTRTCDDSRTYLCMLDPRLTVCQIRAPARVAISTEIRHPGGAVTAKKINRPRLFNHFQPPPPRHPETAWKTDRKGKNHVLTSRHL